MARAAENLGDVPEVERARGWLAVVVEFCRARPVGALGAAVVVLNLVVAVGANVLAPYDPLATDYGAMLAAPTATHWLGTDAFGRDVLSRIIYGARTALTVGIGASVIGTVLGSLIGASSAYFGGRYDLIVQRVMDVL